MKRQQHRRGADSSGDALHGVPLAQAEPAPEAAVEQDPRQLKLFNPPPKDGGDGGVADAGADARSQD